MPPIPRKYSESFADWFTIQLRQCLIEARKGKRSTHDEHDFEMFGEENIRNLAEACLTEMYEPGGGIAFVKLQPVVREIFAAPFRDRVVHHFLHRETMDWWERRFIYDSYSCRVGKGTLLGILRMDEMMRKATRNYTREAYIVQMDLSGFFMSLIRRNLVGAVQWGLDQQFEAGSEIHRMCSYLWEKVLMDDPAGKVQKRGNLELWKLVPHNKSLLKQEPGRGIVIGNLTSQDVSNIYMDRFDRFMKFEMGYKFYGRYVDDFFIILLPDELKRFLAGEREVISGKLMSMGLTLHPHKTKITLAGRPVKFLGARIMKNHISLGPRTIKNMNKAIQDFAHDRATLETLTSYLGMASKYTSIKQLQKAFEAVGWEYRI